MTDNLSPSQEGVELQAPTQPFEIPPSYEFISGDHLKKYDETLREFMNGAAIGGKNAAGQEEGIESFPFELNFDDSFIVAKSEDETSITITAKSGTPTVTAPILKGLIQDGRNITTTIDGDRVRIDASGTGGSGMDIKGVNTTGQAFQKGTSVLELDPSFELEVTEGVNPDTDPARNIKVKVKGSTVKGKDSASSSTTLTDIKTVKYDAAFTVSEESSGTAYVVGKRDVMIKGQKPPVGNAPGVVFTDYATKLNFESSDFTLVEEGGAGGKGFRVETKPTLKVSSSDGEHTGVGEIHFMGSSKVEDISGVTTITTGAVMKGYDKTGSTSQPVEIAVGDLQFDETFNAIKSTDDSGKDTLTVSAKSGAIIVKGTPSDPGSPSQYDHVTTLTFAKGAKIYPPATSVTNEVMVDFGFEVSSYGTAGVVVESNKIEFKGMDVTEEDGKAIVTPIGMDSLTDRHFTIMTVKNGLNAWTARSAALSYSLIQDPMCNVMMIDGSAPNYSTTFMPQATGMYAVTKYVHFTGKEEWKDKQANVEFKLQREDGTTEIQMDVRLTADDKGEFPTAKFYKQSVSLDKNDRLKVMVSINVDGVTASEEVYKDCEMDPYKNIICLEKAQSKTHTGALITAGLFDSLGGTSYQPGVEIRAEKSGDTYTVGAESFNKTIVVVTV